jgi:type II secretory pathway pseudopilin PulG
VTISSRVREESGFGLVELLIAMTVMVVGITAIVAGMSSGIVALQRASQSSTAATLADIQMEGYRKVKYTDAALAPTCSSGTSASTDCFVSSPPTTGPDGRTYRIDAAVRFDCAVGTVGGTVPSSATCTGTGAARPAKLVTIVVYDPSTTPAKELFRETSTFDQATG